MSVFRIGAYCGGHLMDVSHGLLDIAAPSYGGPYL